MNNEQELDEKAIDELLTTASKELLGLDDDHLEITAPQNSSIVIEQLIPPLQTPQIGQPIENSPLPPIKTLKQHFTKKMVFVIFFLFVLVIGAGAYLGYMMADRGESAGANSTIKPPKTVKAPLSTPSITKELPIKALPATMNEKYRLTLGKVGFVKIGMSLSDIQKEYPSLTVSEKYVDGSKKAIATIHFNNQNSPSLELGLSSGTLHLISTISTYDEQFATDKQITIKSTVGDIRNQYTINDIKVIDHSLFLVVKSIKILFELDLSKGFIPTEWLNTGNITSIPSDTKIKRIVLY